MLNKIHYLLFLFLPCMLSCSKATEPTGELPVHPGAYQFDSILPNIEGKKIAIIANHASLVGNVHLVDTLLSLNASSKLAYDIEAVFSPEHGFSGLFDAGKVIDDEDYIFDSIKVVSLYGKNKKPKAKDIENLDVILFDLQDVGVRFYTYISTLHYVMQACAENNIDLIILDRPNPHIHYIDGPLLEKPHNSFVGMHEVPTVYGMTIGEYGRMIEGESWIGDSLHCNLKVIPVLNYSRRTRYSFTTKPSPNLPNMRSVLLYPSLCFFEGTKMSIGRGTSYPFQIVGHPEYPIDSFEFKPVSTPGASLYPKLQDKVCYGESFLPIPMDTLWGVNRLRLDILMDTYAKMGKPSDFFTDYFTLLAGTTKLQEQLEQGLTEKEIRESWKPGLESFNRIRSKYLLYE